MCFESSLSSRSIKTEDAQGSQVLFYGTRTLENGPIEYQQDSSAATTLFSVSQEPGYATIHFGDHPHETTILKNGKRTNIIMTYCYTDPNRSDVATRTCYG